MITSISPALSAVATSIRPEDLLLMENSWVKFTKAWPDTYAWVKTADKMEGKVFKVTQAILVPTPYSYILPGDDYKKLDLSNATAGLKLYPADEGVLYEIALGLKPGEYIIHIYIPTGKYVFALADPTMAPDVDEDDYRYVGARRPEDSPDTCPLLKLYAIKDMAAFQLLDYVEGVDFDKTSIIFFVNKCQLEEIPFPTPEQKERALTIRYYTELTGF